MKIKLIFAWYDFWVGLFWDAKKRRLYVFPVPMLGFYLQFRGAVRPDLPQYQPQTLSGDGEGGFLWGDIGLPTRSMLIARERLRLFADIHKSPASDLRILEIQTETKILSYIT